MTHETLSTLEQEKQLSAEEQVALKALAGVRTPYGNVWQYNPHEAINPVKGSPLRFYEQPQR